MGSGQIHRINLEACAELVWWDWLLDNWVGASMHQFPMLKHPDHHLYTSTRRALGLECMVSAIPAANAVVR